MTPAQAKIIRQLEARERGEPMRRNPKKKKSAAPAMCALKTKVRSLELRNRKLSGELTAARKRKNPRRPPSKWWQDCLSSVSAQHHAADPAAVCGATWWKLPAKRRAAIVRSLERSGSARNRRRAVALAKAERNRHGRARSNPPKRSKKKKSGKRPRRPNPPLYAVAYVERKEGDRRPHVYEHKFSSPRPRLIMQGNDVRIVRKNSRYSTRAGWIHG